MQSSARGLLNSTFCLPEKTDRQTGLPQNYILHVNRNVVSFCMQQVVKLAQEQQATECDQSIMKNNKTVGKRSFL